VLVAELERSLGMVSTVDAEVGAIKTRCQGLGAGGLVVSVAELVLNGYDFMTDLNKVRADAAVGLRAVPDPPAPSTLIGLARHFGDGQFSGIEKAVGVLNRKVFALLDPARRAALTAERPTIDLDGTDVEVYGRKKQGVAYNYAGQLSARVFAATWAESGVPLAADLLAGNEDPLATAPEVMARAVVALPEGLGRPRVRADSGFFSQHVARKALELGADYAIAVKRNPAAWNALRQIPPESWVPADGMRGAEVAVCSYRPKTWQFPGRTIVRRVLTPESQVRRDVRSRRRRTFDPQQLAMFNENAHRGPLYAYSFIVTSLEGDPVDIEAWFRQRASIEDRFRDAKLGMAMRHMPSGHVGVNRLWMWGNLLGLAMSGWIQALGDVDGKPSRAHGKRLRHELINIPARLLHRSRRIELRVTPRDLDGPFSYAWNKLRLLPNAATGG
jgi:hypothetical protein